MLALVVLAVSFLHSEAFLLDALKIDPLHENPFLITTCEPEQSTPQTTVLCEYRIGSLVCTATCAPGYGFATGEKSVTRMCGFQGWTQGRKFPECVSTLSPVRPTGGVNVKGCVRGLADCPGIGLYPACTSCYQFVSCADDGAFLMSCPLSSFFDNNTKRCEVQSSTCRSS